MQTKIYVSVLLIGFIASISFFIFEREQVKGSIESFSSEYMLRPNDEKPSKIIFGKEMTIINFWATWCAPCIEEMPMLSNFHETNKKAGISVVGVAIDNKTNVTKFLEENEISHEIFIAGAKGTNMMEETGLNPKNILPFTLLVGKRLEVIEKKVGKITKDELLYWVDSVER